MFGINRGPVLFTACALALFALLVVVLFKTTSYSYSEAFDPPASIPILMYHSINDTTVGLSDLSVSPEAFNEQMHYLAANGYTAINLDDIDEHAQFDKPIIISFDDGYQDNYTYAYPILKKYSIKATVFIVSGYIDAGGFLTTDQILEMGDLVSFQSHTIEHSRLDWFNSVQIADDCIQSQKAISRITNKSVYALSYPSGTFNANVTRIASKYYDCAVSTLCGTNTSYSNKFQLKRIAVSSEDNLSDFISKINKSKLHS